MKYNKISIENSTHYKWGSNCDGWWLKKGENFTVIYEMMPPHTSEIKHYHKQTEQFFYCLEGQLTMELDEGELLLNPHEGCIIKEGIPHKAKNNADINTSFLVMSAPNAQQDRFNLE